MSIVNSKQIICQKCGYLTVLCKCEELKKENGKENHKPTKKQKSENKNENKNKQNNSQKVIMNLNISFGGGTGGTGGTGDPSSSLNFEISPSDIIEGNHHIDIRTGSKKKKK